MRKLADKKKMVFVLTLMSNFNARRKYELRKVKSRMELNKIHF